MIIIILIQFSILLLITRDLLIIENLIKFSLKILTAFLSCSINVAFFAPLDKASKPKEPTPEYKSKILELFNITSISLE